MNHFFLFLFFTTSIIAIDFTKEKDTLYQDLKILDDKQKISISNDWMKISGWDFSYFGYTANNQDLRGFINKDSMQNPQKDFISFAMEYIHPHQTTIENSIKCKNPQKYLFMKNLFTNFVSPLEQKEIICKKINTGFVDDILFTNPLNGKPIQYDNISIDMVEGFEILYATPGTADASEIAGHLLLRIKLNNNPLAKQLNIENPNDIVVSFLANTPQDNSKINLNLSMQEECTKNYFNIVDENNYDAMNSILQSIQGLSGGFLTMMDRQILAQTIKHYTIEEDRDLLRFELLLNKEQKINLLNRLFIAKKNYNAKYYFFTQNCASVLVKVIAQGIQEKDIVNFNPITSAPNTLVVMFARKNLVKPIYPSFYSYKNKGYMAQDKIQSIIKRYKQNNIYKSFPNVSYLINKDIKNRMYFIDRLTKFYKKNKSENTQIWRVLNLIQEAEMVYEYKDLYCKNYTSKVVENVRKLQSIMLNEDTTLSQNNYNIQKELMQSYTDKNKNTYNNGTSFTKLLPITLGYGKQNHQNIMHFDFSILRQNMGSLSNISMQRSNSVNLGNITANFTNDKKLSSGDLTVLKIKKIQERLNYTPSFFSENGKIGLGLTLIDYHRFTDETTYGSILGGELLFNILSSANYDNYLFASLGAEIGHQITENTNTKGIMFPTYLQSLLTFGYKRKIQWENKLYFNTTINANIKDKVYLKSEIKYRLNTYKNILSILKLSYNNYIKNDERKDESLVLSLELLRW